MEKQIEKEYERSAHRGEQKGEVENIKKTARRLQRRVIWGEKYGHIWPRHATRKILITRFARCGCTTSKHCGTPEPSPPETCHVADKTHFQRVCMGYRGPSR